MRQIQKEKHGRHNPQTQHDPLEQHGQDGLGEIRVRDEVEDAADGVEPRGGCRGGLGDGLGVAELPLERVLDLRHGLRCVCADLFL